MLRSLGVFDTLSYGVEDRARGDRYRVEADRRKLQRELPSLEDFHRSLEMVLTIDPLDERTLARAADLTRRTNQFNLRPTRFTPSELRAAAALPGREAFVFRLRDRFGDYGLVGVGLIAREGSRVELSQFLLSCRVLKRTVEDTVLAFLVERGREGGRADVVAWYQRAPRNEQVRDLLVARGFDEGDGRDDGLVEYRLPAGRTPEASPWVTIAQSPADVGGRR
jgi:FkbH-like protein